MSQGSGASGTLIRIAEADVPPEALETGLGGEVNIWAEIAPTGRVTRIVRVIGPDYLCPSIRTPDVAALRRAATDAVKKERFTPAVRNGRPVASIVMATVSFPKPRGADSVKAPEPVPADNNEPSDTIVGGVVNGKAIRLVKPQYPEAAKILRLSSVVSVGVVIDETGNIVSAKPESGHFIFFPEAHVAACRSTFTPTLLSGEPVKVTGIITFNFQAN